MKKIYKSATGSLKVESHGLFRFVPFLEGIEGRIDENPDGIQYKQQRIGPHRSFISSKIGLP